MPRRCAATGTRPASVDDDAARSDARVLPSGDCNALTSVAAVDVVAGARVSGAPTTGSAASRSPSCVLGVEIDVEATAPRTARAALSVESRSVETVSSTRRTTGVVASSAVSASGTSARPPSTVPVTAASAGSEALVTVSVIAALASVTTAVGPAAAGVAASTTGVTVSTTGAETSVAVSTAAAEAPLTVSTTGAAPPVADSATGEDAAVAASATGAAAAGTGATGAVGAAAGVGGAAATDVTGAVAAPTVVAVVTVVTATVLLGGDAAGTAVPGGAVSPTSADATPANASVSVVTRNATCALGMRVSRGAAIPRKGEYRRRAGFKHRGSLVDDISISLDFLRFGYSGEVPSSVRPVYEVKAGLFRVLGHPARVRIVELLREGERSVGALQAELGLESGATSQHLAALRRVGLVESRRDGTSVFYRAADEKVFDLLDAGRSLVTRQLEGQQSMLRELSET